MYVYYFIYKVGGCVYKNDHTLNDINSYLPSFTMLYFVFFFQDAYLQVL